ncbi:MAG: hypothetical protein WEF50_01350 [Myxococcota bacterium]
MKTGSLSSLRTRARWRGIGTIASKRSSRTRSASRATSTSSASSRPSNLKRRTSVRPVSW